MSAPYTLHLPAGADDRDPAALERADLVRDGFSFGAFVAPMLWFFRHRHWLLGLGALLAVGGLAAALFLAGAGTGTIVAAEILLHLLFGLEGASLRRFALARRGRPVRDVVIAANLAEAEAKSFGRFLAPAEIAVPPARRPAMPLPARPEPVLGLFPDLEGRR